MNQVYSGVSATNPPPLRDQEQEVAGRYRTLDDLAPEPPPRAQSCPARASPPRARLDGGCRAPVAPAPRRAPFGRRFALAKKPTNPPAQAHPKRIGSRTGPA